MRDEARHMALATRATAACAGQLVSPLARARPTAGDLPVSGRRMAARRGIGRPEAPDAV